MTVGPLSGGGNGGGGAVNDSGILSNGLIFHYDVGNPSSYPGSGSTVTDLQGNFVNLTQATGTNRTYISAGTSSYIRANSNPLSLGYQTVPISDFNVAGTLNSTYTSWVKLNTHSSGDESWAINLLGQKSGYFGSRLYYYGPTYANPNYRDLFNVYLYNSQGSLSYVYVANGIFDWNTDWIHIAQVTENNSYPKIYINGTELSIFPSLSSAVPTGTFLDDGSSLDIANLIQNESNKEKWWAGSAFYNRTLSSSEVLGNFNALKSRYGY